MRLKLVVIGAVALLIIISQSLIAFSRYSRRAKRGQIVYNQIRNSKIPWLVLAESVEKRKIYYFEYGTGDYLTIILGAIHGDELLSCKLVLKLAEYLYEVNKLAEDLGAGFLMTSRVIFVPVVNPDGLVRGQRTNANGVDINRNFPTKNWRAHYSERRYCPGRNPASEPETKAITKLLTKYKPDKIITIHEPLHMINYDGPAKQWANEMAKYNRYSVKPYIGYKTPGSLGSYAGKERHIPVISLELPRISIKNAWKRNREALLVAIISEIGKSHSIQNNKVINTN